MPYMNVDDQLHGHRKFVRLGKHRLAASGLWITAGSWCAGALTDGFVPDYIVRQWDPRLFLASQLVAAGLWHESKQDQEVGYQFHDWTEDGHNLPAVRIRKKRDDTRRRQQRWRDEQARKRADQGEQAPEPPDDDPPDESGEDARNALRDASRDRHGDALGTHVPSHPIPSTHKEGTTSLLVGDRAALDDAATVARLDVEDLCERLAARIAGNTGRRPAVTAKWRTDCRLLLDRDLKHEPDPVRLVEAVLDWATADTFWRSNILSMSKLREKFDQLRLKRREEHDRSRAVSNGRPRARTTDEKRAAIPGLIDEVFGPGSSAGMPGAAPHLRAIGGHA